MTNNESINKVLYDVDQRAGTTEQEKKTVRRIDKKCIPPILIGGIFVLNMLWAPLKIALVKKI